MRSIERIARKDGESFLLDCNCREAVGHRDISADAGALPCLSLTAATDRFLPIPVTGGDTNRRLTATRRKRRHLEPGRLIHFGPGNKGLVRISPENQPLQPDPLKGGREGYLIESSRTAAKRNDQRKSPNGLLLERRLHP